MKSLIFTENIDKILAGAKTQTRRIVPEKVSDAYCEYDEYCDTVMPRDVPCTRTYRREFYEQRARILPGEIIYVKEVWGKVGYFNTPQCIAYMADGRTLEEIRQEDLGFEWSKPMFMPKSAARIFLHVTDVRAEPLQEISPQDCHAEGVTNEVCAACLKMDDCCPQRDVDVFCGNDEQLLEQYADLWDKLNSKRNGGTFSWDKNPWVWVYTFERCKNES